MALLLVEHQMARTRAHRRLLIELRELAARAIDGEGGDRATRLALELTDLVDRKQQPAPRVELEERRARRFGGDAERREHRRLRIGGLQSKEVDALALRARVRADVDETGISHRVTCGARESS